MEHIDWKERRRVLFVTFAHLILILILSQLVFYRGIGQLKPIFLINIGIDYVGLLMGFMLYICCLIDLQKKGTNVQYLVALINVVFIALFTDGCAWLVDGLPNLRMLNILDNTIYYMCTSMEAYFFWKYTMTYLKVRGPVVNRLSLAVKIGVYISIGLKILNLFTGIYFTVDHAGVYARSPYNWVSLLYGFFTTVAALVAVVVERRQLDSYQIIIFFMYGLGPIAVGILTIFIYGLSLGPVVIMLDLLLMYCILNVVEGRERAAADRDMALAAKIQVGMLPKSFPFLPERTEFDLFADMIPAKEVGGDFYDFYMVDEDHIALTIADVSGKGMPAALFMMISKVLIKNSVRGGASPAEALYEVNNYLCEGNTLGLFVTVWLGIIDLKTGRGLSANAGHEHPVIRHESGLYELVKYKHSPAVGTMEDIKFREHEFQMEPGDQFFVYTDGVAEANNNEDELLGTDRMLDILNRKPNAKPEEVIENMMEGITEFVDGANQFDDITMLSFAYHG